MKIEAVTVCVDYDDFLEQTIRVNQALFDDWVVVTVAEDKNTHIVCERYGVRTVDCPYVKNKDGSFNKAYGINIGLAHLKCKDWILHLDADTALPRNTRRMLNNIDLDPKGIYGIDRINCPSWEEWQKHLLETDPFQKHYFVHTKNWTVGTRLCHYDYGSWTPIGYFQLWNRESGITRYPTIEDAGAEHTDVLHGLQWHRTDRHLIPEILAIHLATGGPNMGANWKGRKTPRFGPDKKVDDPNKKKYCP